MSAAAIAFLLWLGIALIFGGIGSIIGEGKGREAIGFFLGVFLGLFGWLIVAVLRPTPQGQAKHDEQVARHADAFRTSKQRHCPWCAEGIQFAAKVCRFCGREVDPVAPPVS